VPVFGTGKLDLRCETLLELGVLTREVCCELGVERVFAGALVLTTALEPVPERRMRHADDVGTALDRQTRSEALEELCDDLFGDRVWATASSARPVRTPIG
jgi:hypothetical protein